MLNKRIVALLLALSAGTIGAAPVAAPADQANAIIARIEQRNPALQSFQARVHVDVRMLSFPWLSPKLDGTSYYKRPDNYEVVFDRVPSYAKGFNKLFGDIGDPAAWQKESNVFYDGVQNLDGHPLMALRMTKKIRSDQIKDTVAYVNPVTYQVVRMDWHYVNGGAITMTQTYKRQGSYDVIATQHADIRIPRVHAVANATYGEYQTNVAVDDSVFTKK
jgi:outer membrane lipoprotein-sorting protein